MEKQDKLVKFLGGGGVWFFFRFKYTYIERTGSIVNFKQIPLILPRIYTVILKDLRN